MRSRDHGNELYDTCTHVCHTTRHVVAEWAHTHVAVLFHLYSTSCFFVVETRCTQKLKHSHSKSQAQMNLSDQHTLTAVRYRGNAIPFNRFCPDLTYGMDVPALRVCAFCFTPR